MKRDEVIKFVKFVKNYLKINKLPKIILQNNRVGLITTASYIIDGEKSIIRIWCKKRHKIDIFRSLAHELVHHKQIEGGKLKLPVQDIGGGIENEANSIAGEIIKTYIYENKYLLENTKKKDLLLNEMLSINPIIKIDKPNVKKIKKSTEKELIRLAIISELDAINLYEQFVNTTNDIKLRKVFLDIANEEKTHVGELQSILKDLDSDFKKELKKGEVEVKKINKIK
jgi:hypothetical protein